MESIRCAFISRFFLSLLFTVLFSNSSRATCPHNDCGSDAGVVRQGPSGGSGQHWEILNPQNHKIRSIKVSTGAYVDSIELFARDERTGQEYSLGKAGGSKGSQEHIGLGKKERLIGIFGKSGAVLDSVGFITNYRTYGPYGGSGGPTNFRYESKKQIHGLWGNSGTFWFSHVITAIGIYSNSK